MRSWEHLSGGQVTAMPGVTRVVQRTKSLSGGGVKRVRAELSGSSRAL